MSSVSKVEEMVIKSVPIFMNKKTFEVYSKLTLKNRNILHESTSLYFSEILIQMIEKGFLTKEEYGS